MDPTVKLDILLLNHKLEALRERRPPWPRQIITLILPTVKMLSLGCEKPPTPPLKKKMVLDHYLHHDLGMLPLLWWFFSSPGTNVLGELLSYPRRRRRCRRRRRRRCCRRRQFQVKVFVY